MESEQNDLISPEEISPEEAADLSLRPKLLSDFVGQNQIVDNLKVFIQSAQKRKKALDHVLLSGPPGLGKTSLANIIANELRVGFRSTAGPVIEKQGDLAAILTNLEPFQVLFIDEIHRMSKVIEEVLYSAMEDFTLDIMIGQGPSARTVKLDLPPFTLIGATTRTGLISSPLRDRFGIPLRFEYYTPKDLQEIVIRSAGILGVDIYEEAALEIGKRSRGTPRIANRLLKRTRDFAELESEGLITIEIVKDTLNRLGVDSLGLDNLDRSLLEKTIELYNGGPVGLRTLSAVISEEKDTIEDVVEPFLIQIGLIKRTSRGRVITQKAYDHLKVNRDSPESQLQF